MSDDVATNDTDDKRKERTPQEVSTFWQVQLGLAVQDQRDWAQEAQACVERYKTEKKIAGKARRQNKRFNVFYSNVETMKAALYGRTAKPDVRRRFGDKDPTARVAADVIERSLIYCQEVSEVDKPIGASVHDSEVVGRGVMWVEYEPVFAQRPMMDPFTGMPAIDETGAPAVEDFIADQKLTLIHLHWQDYLQSPARDWTGVWWTARRHLMTREELEDNKFPDARLAPLAWSPDTDKKDIPDSFKKAEVWEIWDKSKRQRVWIVRGFDRPLRVDDDPYGLDGFFPLDEPTRAIDDTDTLVPTTSLSVYRDQADDLDEVTARISILTKALKRRGVYDQTVKELARLARAGDNEFIPVSNYQDLAQKGGLAAAFQTEDISILSSVLMELYKQRQSLKGEIWEITGIADVMRGNSDPNETLGAQQLKAQFGSQRLKRRQRAVQKWIAGTYKIMAEIIAEHFEPQMLSEMTGMQVTPEVMDLLRSDRLRSYRIDIETDSTVFEDAEAEKKSTVEMLAALGGFLEKAPAVLQQAPELAPLMFEMMSMGLRTFKQGKQLEDSIEQVRASIEQKMAQPPPPPPPDPKIEQIKAEMARDQQSHDMDMQEKGVSMQGKVIDLQSKQRQALIQNQAPLQ